MIFIGLNLMAGWKTTLHLFDFIQREIEFENIHARLTEKTKLAPLGILIDKGCNHGFTYT
jgi:hypothetical protein